MKCLWKCPSSTNPYSCPENFLFVHLYSGIILFAKRFILNVWHCSEYICLGVIQWPYAMYWIRNVQNNSGIFSTVFFGIRRHIQSYSALLRHIHSYWDIIKASYSAPFVTLAYSKPWHVLSPGIFRTGGLFKALWNVDQTYSEPCHSPSFGHIQAYLKPCAMQKPDILGILEYSEPFHNYILTYNQNPVIFTKIYEYSELWHIQNPTHM